MERGILCSYPRADLCWSKYVAKDREITAKQKPERFESSMSHRELLMNFHDTLAFIWIALVYYLAEVVGMQVVGCQEVCISKRLYVDGCFAFMFVCLLLVCLVPTDTRRRHQIPWDMSYRQQWDTMWDLRTEFRSSRWSASAHNQWAISLAPIFFKLF